MDVNDPYEITDGGEPRETKNYKEALNDYFKIRRKYQDKIYDMKKKIYEKEPNKKIALRKTLAIKPPCIHCGRPVGTIFSSKEKKYVAVCGDRENPCILNIELFRGNHMNIEYILNIFKEEIDILKENIIQQKLDTFFNYLNDQQSISLYKKEVRAYNGDSVIYKEIMDTYNSLYDNKDKQEMIIQKNEEVFRLIEKSRGFLKEYQKTQNSDFLKLAVETNIKEITPLIENMRVLNNEIIEIDVAENSNNIKTYTLYKYPVLLSKIDYNIGEHPRVVKYMV